jgi:hypothetical protein
MPLRLKLSTPFLFVPLLLLGASAATPRSVEGQADQIEQIRQIERERLRALVSADLSTARRLHADDFQLINPAGASLSKTEYLGQIESGQLDYRAWEAGEITVRLYGDVVAIRYRDVRFEVDIQGKPVHRGAMVHTNVYERRGGQWQVVWSQASGIITPATSGQP